MIKRILRFLGFIVLSAICGFVWYVVGTTDYPIQVKQDMYFGLFIFIFAVLTIVIVCCVYYSFIDLFKKEKEHDNWNIW